MFQLFKHIKATKDVSSTILLCVIAGVALWIVALPFSTTVQDAYLKRFHLDSQNFVTWAWQQPVPAMYNFENRVCYSPTQISEEEFNSALIRDPNQKPGPIIGPVEEDCEPRPHRPVFETINHFPTRSFTFANAIYKHRNDLNGYFYLTTRYRGRELRSAYEMKTISETEFEVNRLFGTGVVQ